MNLNYLDGAAICHTNSSRLETSARIIVKDADGTDAFCLFLYYIAYEEMAKALFCLFVHKGWITEEFVKPVFTDHQSKIFLFDEFFRTFEVVDGIVYLGGKPLGDISLSDFKKQHDEEIKKHREFTMDLLYVDRGDSDWISPEFEMKNFAEEERKIQKRIDGLATIYEFLITYLGKTSKHLDNFKFSEEGEMGFTMHWDEK